MDDPAPSFERHFRAVPDPRVVGRCEHKHSRRNVPFRPEAGDAVIGRVVGVMSGPSITP